MAILLVYSTSGITIGEKVCRDLEMAAILKILKYQTQLQFELRYETVPNYTKKVIFMVMTSLMVIEIWACILRLGVLPHVTLCMWFKPRWSPGQCMHKSQNLLWVVYLRVFYHSTWKLTKLTMILVRYLWWKCQNYAICISHTAMQ